MEVIRLIMILLAFSISSLLIPANSHTDGDACAEEKCSEDGPAIRFPFRLRGKHSEHCCYNSSYDLHCDKEKRTILELTSSSKKVVVTNISYSAQRVTIESAEGCFSKQLRDLDTTLYPFQYYHESKFYQVSLFNCSSEWNRIKLEGFMPCLPADEYLVSYVPKNDKLLEYVDSVSGYDGPGSDLQSCVKMYDTKVIPPGMILYGHPLELWWSEPNCGKCWQRGGFCGWKNRSTKEYGCFGETKSSHDSGVLKILSASGSIIGCFLLVPAIGAMFFLYSRMQQQKENEKKIRKFLKDYAAMKPSRYSYADIKNMTNNFKHKLGEGAYGNVFKGKISNKLYVAVKVLHNSIGNGDDFINEVGTIGTIHHVNVVRLLGFCADEYNRALVFEFLPNGSLDKFIRKDGEERHTLDTGKMQSIAIGIARGIEYLHQGCQQRILHFDIKPHNILLDGRYNPKISDFGLAKLCEKGKSVVSMTAARGTMGYIAPEVFSRQFGNVSYKSDIYSFGMLLLEMIGRRKNIDTTTQIISQVYFPEWLYERLANGEELRIQIEEEGEVEITKRLAIVGLWCIQWNPVDRPSIASVLQMLEGNGDNLNVPPNPFTSTSTSEQRREINPSLAAISESE